MGWERERAVVMDELEVGGMNGGEMREKGDEGWVEYTECGKKSQNRAPTKSGKEKSFWLLHGEGTW